MAKKEKRQRRGRRQEWRPNPLTWLLYTIWRIGATALKIIAGTVATVLLKVQMPLAGTGVSCPSHCRNTWKFKVAVAVSVKILLKNSTLTQGFLYALLSTFKFTKGNTAPTSVSAGMVVAP